MTPFHCIITILVLTLIALFLNKKMHVDSTILASSIAAIGIVVGLGLYIPAVMGTIVGFLILVGLDPIGHKIPSVKYSQITIISEMEPAEEIET